MGQPKTGSAAGRYRPAMRLRRAAVMLPREGVDRVDVGRLLLEEVAPCGGHGRRREGVIVAPRREDELESSAEAARGLAAHVLGERVDRVGVDARRVVPDD